MALCVSGVAREFNIRSQVFDTKSATKLLNVHSWTVGWWKKLDNLKREIQECEVWDSKCNALSDLWLPTYLFLVGPKMKRIFGKSTLRHCGQSHVESKKVTLD